MVFSSSVFLWMFLPCVMVLYYLFNDKYRNLLLLVASLLFYAWGEPIYVFLMIGSILVNYMFGIWVGSTQKSGQKKFILCISIILNLGMLGVFKYSNFIIDSINSISGRELLSQVNIALPIGISFFTFQILSYVVDVYRGGIKPQRNLISLALYISFFPQLIAGPIVKYHDIELQLRNRTSNVDKIYDGVRRFLLGLGKKMIFANGFGVIADQIFGLTIAQLSTKTAWLGILCYTFQVYYDFSGYSDMAIGLGKIFGFDFMENFNYPYLSQSIKEFWRRWHISLSTWFREYLYIPLGGNRKGNVRTYINLLIVFFATGLWHGASWNYVIWGMFHGVFLVIERLFLGKVLEKNPIKILNRVYTLLTVVIAWVFFRADTLTQALGYIKTMFVYEPDTFYGITSYINPYFLIIAILGVLLCGIVQSTKIAKKVNQLSTTSLYHVSEIVLYIVILFMVTLLLSSGAYNPFIYFKF